MSLACSVGAEDAKLSTLLLALSLTARKLLQLLHVREKSTPPDIVLEAAGRVAAELAKLFHLLQKIQSILHVLHLKLQTLRHKVTEGKLPKAVKEAENLIRKPLEVGGLQ